MATIKTNMQILKRIYSTPKDKELDTGIRTNFILINNVFRVNVFSRKTMINPDFLKPIK